MPLVLKIFFDRIGDPTAQSHVMGEVKRAITKREQCAPQITNRFMARCQINERPDIELTALNRYSVELSRRSILLLPKQVVRIVLTCLHGGRYLVQYLFVDE